MLQIFRSIHTSWAGGLTAESKTKWDPDRLHEIPNKARTLPRGLGSQQKKTQQSQGKGKQLTLLTAWTLTLIANLVRPRGKAARVTITKSLQNKMSVSITVECHHNCLAENNNKKKKKIQ